MIDTNHFAVCVYRNGDLVVTIESNSLSGRDLLPGDDDTIRTAAHSLLGFIGEPAERATELAALTEGHEQLKTQLAEQRAELTGRLSEAFRSLPACYDTPADHYREMARRLSEDRDALKHRNRALTEVHERLRKKVQVLIHEMRSAALDRPILTPFANAFDALLSPREGTPQESHE